MFKTILSVISGAIIAIGSFLSPTHTKQSLPEAPLLGITQQVAASTYTIAGGGIAPSDTSFTLQSFTITQTGQPIVTGNLSTIFYLTLEPGNRTKQEIVGCTTVTQNAGGTALISGCSRGLSPITPYTASSTLAFSHAGGSQVIISNPPQVFNQYVAKDNNETITGTYNFSNGFVSTASTTFTAQLNANGNTYLPLIASSTFTGPAQFLSTVNALYQTASSTLVTNGRLNDVSFAGVSNANTTTKGIVQEATLAQINGGTSSGSTGAQLYVNPATFALSNFASSTSAKTFFPNPFLIPLNNTNPITGGNPPNNATVGIGQVSLPYKLTVNQLSFDIQGLTGTASTTIALFSEDGQTRYFSTTSPLYSTTGVKTLTFQSPVVVPAGIAYLGIITNSPNTSYYSFNLNTSGPFSDGLYAVSGKPSVYGTTTAATGSSMPLTITPGSIANGNSSASQSLLPIIRLDN